MPFCNVSYLLCGFVPLFTWQHHGDPSALRVLFLLFVILKCLVRLSLKLIRCHALSICHFPCHFLLACSLHCCYFCKFFFIYFSISLNCFLWDFLLHSVLVFCLVSEGWQWQWRWLGNSFRFLVDLQALVTPYRVERTLWAYVRRVKWWYVAYYCQFLWDFHVWLHLGFLADGCSVLKWMC